jgi:hypothetical protein
MATFNKFQCFVADKNNGIHNLASNQLTVALCATANAPVATNTVLANLTEISYTNLSSRNITTTSSTQTAGLYKLILANLTLTASGVVAAFRYVVIYNSTAASKNLIGWVDYGADVNLALNGETFPITFDQTNGLFTDQ